ncbi:MAG: PDZ domain-containing protein, partial [Tabrizicola sp.]
GDVITRFGTNDVSDAGDLTRRVADAPIGEAVPVIVLREGRTETLAVTLGRREDAEAKTMPASSPAPDAPKEMETLGLTLAPLDDDMRARLGLDPSAGGLMIMKVDQTSEAFTKGLVEGDLITEAGQQKIVRLQDLEDRIKEAKAAGRKSILLLVRRGGDPRFVALSIE